VKNGQLTLSVVNPHATLPADATITLRAGAALDANLSVLTNEELTAHNTFDDPSTLIPQTTTIQIPPDGSEWRCTFPAASVTVMKANIEI